jgi:hypothetical protein
VEKHQGMKRQNLLKFQAVDKIFIKYDRSQACFERVRNRLDIISPFTYHTQAFATGLTAAAGIKRHGN